MANKGNNYNDIPLPVPTEGIILETTLSHYVSPEGAVSYAENFHFDTIGKITSRQPIRQITNLNNHGLSSHSDGRAMIYAPSGSAYIVWNDSGTLKYCAADGTGSVTSIAGAFTSTMKDMDILQNLLIWANDTGSQPKYFNGSTVSTIAGTSFPTNSSFNLISAGFVGRVWVAASADTNNRVYYSDVIPSGGLASLTGGSNYISVNPNNTDTIRALIRAQNCLFVFTNNSIYRIYSTQSVDNSPCANVGTPSFKSVTEAKDGIYFYHTSGIYRLSEDGSAVEISQRIRDFINRVNPLYTPTEISAWSDDNHVYFSFSGALNSSSGNAPILGYPNDRCYIAAYTISTQTWTIYSILGATITQVAATNPNYTGALGAGVDSSPLTVLFLTDTSGNTIGGTYNNINLISGGTDTPNDCGLSPISVRCETNWQTFGSETHLKRISGISVASENAAGIDIGYIIDKDGTNNIKHIGSLSSEYITLYRDFQSVEFNRIKFIITGNVTTPVTIGQITIIGLDDLGYKYN